MLIEVDKGKITRLLAYIAAVLVAGYLLTQYAALFAGRERLLGLVRLLDMDQEATLPAYFSSLLLMFCGLLLALIALQTRQQSGRFYWHWLVLAVIFVFLSIDEAVSIHEALKAPVRAALNIGRGPLWFAWVIPYGIGVILLSIIYAPMLMAQEPRTRTLMVISAVLYISGAIGMEMLAATYHANAGTQVFYKMVVVTGEETLEMAGLITFVHALFGVVESGDRELRLSLNR